MAVSFLHVLMTTHDGFYRLQPPRLEKLTDTFIFFGEQCFGIAHHLFQSIGGKFHRSVLVHVDDLAGRHIHTGDAHRHLHGMYGLRAMARANPASQILEIHRPDLVYVARGAIGYRADSAASAHRRGHVATGQAYLISDVTGKLLLETEYRWLA